MRLPQSSHSPWNSPYPFPIEHLQVLLDLDVSWSKLIAAILSNDQPETIMSGLVNWNGNNPLLARIVGELDATTSLSLAPKIGALQEAKSVLKDYFSQVFIVNNDNQLPFTKRVNQILAANSLQPELVKLLPNELTDLKNHFAELEQKQQKKKNLNIRFLIAFLRDEKLFNLLADQTYKQKLIEIVLALELPEITLPTIEEILRLALEAHQLICTVPTMQLNQIDNIPNLSQLLMSTLQPEKAVELAKKVIELAARLTLLWSKILVIITPPSLIKIQQLQEIFNAMRNALNDPFKDKNEPISASKFLQQQTNSGRALNFSQSKRQHLLELEQGLTKKVLRGYIFTALNSTEKGTIHTNFAYIRFVEFTFENCEFRNFSFANSIMKKCQFKNVIFSGELDITDMLID